jgi:uncharacterized membrane protein YdbT with pleckstrin-like domain
MYNPVKSFLLKILKTPPEPEDPMGNVKSLKVFRASYNYYRYKLYLWLIKTIIGKLVTLAVCVYIAVSVSDSMKSSLGLALGVSIALIVLICSIIGSFFSYFMLRLDYEMRWYKVSDRSLRIREGVLYVKEMTMTFVNIQNISVSQGPLQRFFKIADLKVETAGGGGSFNSQQNSEMGLNDAHTAYFRGVDNAEEISEMMKSRLKKAQSSGLGNNEDRRAEKKSQEKANKKDLSAYLPLLREMAEEAEKYREASEKIISL